MDASPGGIRIARTLDLRGTPCPLNFVKTKLALELLIPGEILEVFVDCGEPSENVPRSVSDEGHRVLEAGEAGGVFRMLIERT